MKQTSDLIKLSIALLDLVLITGAFLVAHWLRFGSFKGVDEFVWLYYFSAPVILILLLRHGVLTGFRYRKLREIFWSALGAFLIAGVISSTVLYLSKTADYSRLLFGNYFALATIFTLVEKVIVKKLFDRHLRRGGMNIRIAVVGFGQKFDEILEELRERPQWGISPVQVLDSRNMGVKSIVAIIRSSIVDEVYIAYPRSAVYHEQIDELLTGLENLGMPVRVMLNFDDLQEYYGQNVCRMANKIGVLLAPHNLDPDQLIIKRTMDISGSIVGLVILACIFPFIALAIKLESRGPIFFSQLRVGKGGREFKLYKFRSMCMDAEARKKELLEHNIHDGALFKMENDPRVTRVGRFIRKYSLDELPQFWNVFMGEMALVGTRPPTTDEVSDYEDHHYRRISIRPGLTGFWQVNGRNHVSKFEDVVAMDVLYIKKWSFCMDVKIILRTIWVVFFPKGNQGK